MEERNKQNGQAGAQNKEISGASARTFTQEEVNKIVSERLAKERAKTETAQASQISEQEQTLRDRENRLACREYLQAQGLRDELLEVLDTRDPADFRAKLKRLLEICPTVDERVSPPPVFSQMTQAGPQELCGDPFAKAFGRKQ